MLMNIWFSFGFGFYGYGFQYLETFSIMEKASETDPTTNISIKFYNKMTYSVHYSFNEQVLKIMFKSDNSLICCKFLKTWDCEFLLSFQKNATINIIYCTCVIYK